MRASPAPGTAAAAAAAAAGAAVAPSRGLAGNHCGRDPPCFGAYGRLVGARRDNHTRV